MGAMEAITAKDKALKMRATVIFRRDEQILFVRKRNSKWNLPGGKVELGETPLEAALREMAEETGLKFDNLAYVSEYKEDSVVHFLFEAEPAAQRSTGKKPRPCSEIDDCRWLTMAEMAKRNVRRPIQSLLKRCASDQATRFQAKAAG